jgi:hypothetical protein
MDGNPLSVVAVVSMNGGEALVLNRPLRFVYEQDGRDYVGVDGPFRDRLVYKQADRYSRAFAGRSMTLLLKDGSKVQVKDHWWQAHFPGWVSIPHGDVESLKKCYVFGGGACIDRDDFDAMRATYTGCVYPYWDYEKIIKHDDMRKDLYRRIFHQERRIKTLISVVREKHAALSQPATQQGEQS